jgi:hypothetical protein
VQHGRARVESDFPREIKPKDEIVLRVQELSVESLLEQLTLN